VPLRRQAEPGAQHGCHPAPASNVQAADPISKEAASISQNATPSSQIAAFLRETAASISQQAAS
jgi:hypothetical protein